MSTWEKIGTTAAVIAAAAAVGALGVSKAPRREDGVAGEMQGKRIFIQRSGRRAFELPQQHTAEVLDHGGAMSGAPGMGEGPIPEVRGYPFMND